MTQRGQRRTVYGVDFSGAAEAGTRIRVARGTIAENRLRIEKCTRGDELPGSGRDRATCLAALRNLVAAHTEAVFGFDFPFSLPAPLIHKLFGKVTWERLIHDFPKRFPTPERFRADCLAAADGRELKGESGRECRAPFSAYNIRLFLQTYYGITEVLRPLVQGGAARVLPMQQVEAGKPWLLEICPASTLKRIEIYLPYKGPTPPHLSARKAMLMSMEKKGPLSFAAPSIRQAALDDRTGDALDSVVAAFAVFKNLQDPSFDLQHPVLATATSIEGFIYT